MGKKTGPPGVPRGQPCDKLTGNVRNKKKKQVIFRGSILQLWEMLLKKSAGDFEVICFGFGRPFFKQKKGGEIDFQDDNSK